MQSESDLLYTRIASYAAETAKLLGEASGSGLHQDGIARTICPASRAKRSFRLSLMRTLRVVRAIPEDKLRSDELLMAELLKLSFQAEVLLAKIEHPVAELKDRLPEFEVGLDSTGHRDGLIEKLGHVNDIHNSYSCALELMKNYDKWVERTGEEDLFGLIKTLILGPMEIAMSMSRG